MSLEDNAYSLTKKLAERGAILLVRALDLLREGKALRQPQPEAGASLAPPISREMRHLDWQLPASEVAGWIRALDPAPGAYTLWKGQVLKLFKAKVKKTAGSFAPPGAVNRLTPHGLEIACGQGSITVQEVQLAGHRRMTAAEFLRGHPLMKQVLT
jgi:methionyl-tRNA formyltransferase